MQGALPTVSKTGWLMVPSAGDRGSRPRAGSTSITAAGRSRRWMRGRATEMSVGKTSVNNSSLNGPGNDSRSSANFQEALTMPESEVNEAVRK